MTKNLLKMNFLMIYGGKLHNMITRIIKREEIENGRITTVFEFKKKTKKNRNFLIVNEDKKNQIKNRMIRTEEFEKLSFDEQDYVYHLDISNTRKNFHYLPVKLKSFNCSNCDIDNLGNGILPKTIKVFICSDNKLSVLPNLPEGLEQLNCSNNNLKYLPVLPESLIFLDCRGNNLLNIEDILKNKNSKLKIFYDKKELTIIDHDMVNTVKEYDSVDALEPIDIDIDFD